MSLNKNDMKRSAKGSYNRASHRNVIKDEVEDMNSHLFEDWEHDYDDSPSLGDIRYGWLLSLLKDLRISAAKVLLKYWYW